MLLLPCNQKNLPPSRFSGVKPLLSLVALQAHDIAGAPAAAAGVMARLLEAAAAEAALPGLRSRGQPALLLQGGAIVDVRAYLRYRAGKGHASEGCQMTVRRT